MPGSSSGFLGHILQTKSLFKWRRFDSQVRIPTTMPHLYWPTLPLVNKLKMIRFKRGPIRLPQFRTFSVITRFASSDWVFPSGLAAFSSRYNMIQRKFFMFKYFQAILTLIHISKVHVAAAKLCALFEAKVFFSHTDTRDFHLEFFTTNGPVVIFFKNRYSTQEVQFDGVLPTNNT